jgi:hypothetical protein
MQALRGFLKDTGETRRFAKAVGKIGHFVRSFNEESFLYKGLKDARCL